MTGYVCLWEFHVEPAQKAEFEYHYGPGGTWSALFRQASGYIETLLLQDCSGALRYITIDRWQSEQAYRAFRAAYGQQYDNLDRERQTLSIREIALGEFTDPR